MGFKDTKNLTTGQYNGSNLSTGYYPNAKKPFDVRTIVDTIANMYKIMQTHPGMKVTVLGTMVLANSVETYPDAATYECIADRNPVAPPGNTTSPEDWRQVIGGLSINAGYQGPYDADTNTPDLKNNGVRNQLEAGDFFRVSVAKATGVGLDGISTLAVNDAVFWNGAAFNRFVYTDPLTGIPLYTTLDGTKFNTDVKQLVIDNAIRYWSDEAMVVNEVRLHKYTNADGKQVIDMYRAVNAMTVAVNKLPTTRSLATGGVANTNWELIGTTDTGSSIKRDDTIGNTAKADPPTTRSDVYLSPQEIDARIKEYGGKVDTIQGGTPLTFTGPDLTEPAKD